MRRDEETTRCSVQLQCESGLQRKQQGDTVRRLTKDYPYYEAAVVRKFPHYRLTIPLLVTAVYYLSSTRGTRPRS